MNQLVYRIERLPDRSVVIRRGPFPGRAGPVLLGLTAAGALVVVTPVVLGVGLVVQWVTGSAWLVDHGVLAAIGGVGVAGGLYAYTHHFRRPRQIVFDWEREELHLGLRRRPIPFGELESISVNKVRTDEEDPLYEVVVYIQGGRSVVVGEFGTGGEAEEWQAELWERVGCRGKTVDHEYPE